MMIVSDHETTLSFSLMQPDSKKVIS